jgi:hypothetical protein
MGCQIGESANVGEKDGNVAVLLDINSAELLVRLIPINVLFHIIGNVLWNDRK